MTKSSLVSAAFAVSVLLGTPRAQAQQAEDQAAARSLFDDGRTLMKAGQFASACPKFEAAARLYESAGVLLNLGDCYEKIGRTASAWTEFGESAAAAERANRRDQAIEARKRQADLKPKLSRLAIRVPHEVPGLVVTRDDSDLAPAAWGSAIPIDSGAHRIRARAAGHDPWETSVTVSTPGQTIAVDVPELAASPIAATPAPPASAEEPAKDTGNAFVDREPAKPRSRIPGYALIGAGALVGIGGGVLMGIEAGRASTARADETSNGYAAAKSAYDGTKSPYFIGLGAVILGGATATLGVVWIVTSHGGKRSTSVGSAIGASPWVTPGGGGLSLRAPW